MNATVTEHVLLIRFRSIYLQLGLHTFPPRFNLGAGLAIKWGYVSLSLTFARWGAFLEILL